MTRDEIVEIAWDVGLFMHSHKFQDHPTKLERFAERIVAVEREACAKVCDSEVEKLTQWHPREALAVGVCAAAIRARGKT